MINIIAKFFALYENHKIYISWDKANLSFNLENGPQSMDQILEDLNNDEDKDNLFEEKDIVNVFFAIIANRISNFYDEDVIDEELDSEIDEYINENVDKETLKKIETDIFFDNNIFNNRLNKINYEILTKRDLDDIQEIKGYTANISFFLENRKEQDEKFEIELKLSELDEMITELSKIKSSLERLVN